MRLLVAVVLLIASATASAMAQAKPVEKWECKDRFDYDGWKSILATATVDSGRETGTIAVAGVTYKAGFAVKGFNRFWIFGDEGKFGLRYAFTIEPNGDAKYYDFGPDGPDEDVMPSNFMTCRQR